MTLLSWTTPPLSSHSQEDIESNDGTANFLLSSSHEPQAMPTLLAPVLLNMDSDTRMNMVVDLNAATLAPVTTKELANSIRQEFVLGLQDLLPMISFICPDPPPQKDLLCSTSYLFPSQTNVYG